MTKHFLLFYEVSDDYLERRPAFRDEHLKLAWSAVGQGSLLLGGALAEPADGAVLLFRGDDVSVAEQFAKADPYVREKLVSRWHVREWTTVVGEFATAPLRPDPA